MQVADRPGRALRRRWLPRALAPLIDRPVGGPDDRSPPNITLILHMSNSQARVPELYSRLLLFRHALDAELKARRQHLPPMPTALPHLLPALQQGMPGMLGLPGVREGLVQLRACLFEVQGRDAEARTAWHESWRARCSLRRWPGFGRAGHTAACGGLLHRAGEMLALKILARVELEYRSKLDGPARREWCASHCHELQERLLRSWPLPPEIGACLLGWNRFGELAQMSPAGAAVYLGRLLGLRHLQPDVCVPGVLEQAAGVLGVSAEQLEGLHREADAVRGLIRALD